MRRLVILAWLLPAVAGCTHRVHVDPIQVEPIHLTLDVRLRVDRELDEFFEFEEELAPPPAPADDGVSSEPAPATAPIDPPPQGVTPQGVTP